MENPKVSIIVPVYKVEKYLEKCLESILSQTFTDFECILVDDCSPDKCPEICDEYVKKDSRVKVIHNKQNQGSVEARRTGLNESKGAYILFIDSDDWIEEEMVERLYTRAINNNCDIVYCDFDEFSGFQENGKRVINNIFDMRKMEKTDIVITLLRNQLFSIWNKLFKRELFENIIFPGYQYGEDAVLCTQLFLKAENIGYEYSILYHYRRHPDSITLRNDRNSEKIRRKELYNNFSVIREILLLREDYDKYKNTINRIMKWAAHGTLWKLVINFVPYGILKKYRQRKWN